MCPFAIVKGSCIKESYTVTLRTFAALVVKNAALINLSAFHSYAKTDKLKPDRFTSLVLMKLIS
jgi:hypothetical protein